MLGATAGQISQTRSWAGVAQHGRNALIDPRDVAGAASAVLRDSRHWGGNLDLTGPKAYSWPDVARALTDELGVPVTFQALEEAALRAQLTGRGAPAALVDLVLAREAAIEAGENDRVVNNLELLTGRTARTLEAFLHENRAAFRPGDGPARVS